MKIASMIFAIIVGFSIVSCEKNNEIYYPPSGLHGPNLLVKGSSSTITTNESLSMRANLSKHSTLKIIITNTSNYSGPAANAPIWITSGENNWKLSSYQSHQQEFTTVKRADKADLALKFINSHGSARIDFYENSSLITKSIMVNW